MTLTRRDFNKVGLGTLGLAALGGGAFAGETLIRKTVPSTGETVPVIGLGTNRYGVGGDAAARATHAQLEASLSRLRIQHFDLMQVHNLRGWREAVPVLREWKLEGRVRYVGITTSRENEYEEFEQVMRSETLDFVQLNYSLEQREAAKRLLPLAAERGIAVIINRAFGGGRIFDKVGSTPVPDWARAFGCETWAQFLLKYAVGHPAATLSIPGMTKAHHVDDNLGAARGRLPDAAERQRQEAFFDAL